LLAEDIEDMDATQVEAIQAAEASWLQWLNYAVQLWDTLNIAMLGTVLAILIAVLVAFGAARTTTPSAIAVRPIALLIVAASRSINSLLWALILVTIIGPGVFAGILAIGLRLVGFIAKLLYEALEEIDLSPRPLPALWSIAGHQHS
jgi:phosphonate transport system permease protein